MEDLHTGGTIIIAYGCIFWYQLHGNIRQRNAWFTEGNYRFQDNASAHTAQKTAYSNTNFGYTQPIRLIYLTLLALLAP